MSFADIVIALVLLVVATAQCGDLNGPLLINYDLGFFQVSVQGE